MLVTFSGKYAIEIPRFPSKILFRYVKYCPSRGSFVRPKVSLSAFIASGFNLPRKRAKIIEAGSPGMNLGIKKFRVRAAKEAIK